GDRTHAGDHATPRAPPGSAALGVALRGVTLRAVLPTTRRRRRGRGAQPRDALLAVLPAGVEALAVDVVVERRRQVVRRFRRLGLRPFLRRTFDVDAQAGDSRRFV